MPTIGNLINPEYYQKDNSNVKNPLSDLGDILLKRQDDNLALSRQKELQKYQLDLENQQIQQNNLRALAEAAAFNERQTKLGGLVDNSMNQDKSIYSKASTLADNPSGYGVKIIKPKPAPPTAMMQLASGAFGDVMGNEIPNTQPEVISQPTPTIPKGGRTIPRQVAQMKVGGKGEMSYSIEDNPEFKDLQDIKMKVAEAGGDASQITDVESGLKMLADKKSEATFRDKRILKQNELMNTNRIRKEFIDRPEVKDYVTVSTNVNAMDSLLKKGLAGDVKNKVALDQGLITMYNKLTDPQSVVRESEYARTPSNLPIINAITGAIQKVQAGGAGLTDADRAALVQGAKIIANERGNTYNNTMAEYQMIAEGSGLDSNMITRGMKEHTPYDVGGEQAGTQADEFQEGQTATNPSTGERIIYRGGTWQKI